VIRIEQYLPKGEIFDCVQIGVTSTIRPDS